jgi:hypothetical protein
MEKALEILTTELCIKDEIIAEKMNDLVTAKDRIIQLEYTLRMLKSQLLDTHKEDSVIITIINNSLNK